MEENTNRLQMTEEFIEKRQKLQRIEAEIKKTVILADRKRLPVKKANSDIAISLPESMMTLSVFPDFPRSSRSVSDGYC